MENSNVTPFVPKDSNKDENNSYINSLSPREIVSELDLSLYTSPSPRD